MNIKVDNPIPNIKVSVNKNPDGSFSISLSEIGVAKKRTLGSMKRGSIVKLGDREYIVLEHSKDTTTVITKEFTKKIPIGNWYL